MTRIYVICEGQTEETFIKEVLAPELSSNKIYLFPSMVGKVGHQGGNVKYTRVVRDVQMFMNDGSAYCTTFFDFYGLHEMFPGKQEANKMTDIATKQSIIHSEFVKKLNEDIGDQITKRFIPYIQMYEFEALLFSDTNILANSIGNTKLSTDFSSIRAEFETPEHINNSKDTAPSKRIIASYPNYDKVIQGNIAALDIGIHSILKECLLFSQWIKQLRGLPLDNLQT